jgi:molecular chaperone DnaK
MAADNKKLATFRLDGIPPAPRGVPQIEVTFDIDANGILNVAAKDKATNKEQKVTITASSMLAKDDVDRMVREAAEHAEEDRARRSATESRNEADALVYQGERLLKDLDDKLSDEEKAEVNTRMDAVREALKGEDTGVIDSTKSHLAEVLQRIGTKAYEPSPEGGDTDDIQQKTAALTQAAMKLGQAMYEQQQAQAQQAGGEGSGANDGAAEQPAGQEEVVDAEFSEVDENENKG